MSILLENMPMIGVNSFLALIPILFGWLMLKTRQTLLQVAFALMWFSFLPNTLYILTDLRYLPEQWTTSCRPQIGRCDRWHPDPIVLIGCHPMWERGDRGLRPESQTRCCLWRRPRPHCDGGRPGCDTNQR